MASLIEPRTLKGFRDYPPDLQLPREEILDKARRVYRSYGYLPMDTPALEYAEILLGKGGEETDKQLYRFRDHGGRDVALRFDLTVPFARFAAEHIHRFGTPFKRYHIGPVWRGENPQRGRYREFVQCDFDTIGTTSNAADIEVVFVIYDLLRALGLERFHIHVNHRLVLNGLLEELGLADRAVSVLRALDKYGKVGRQGVEQELRTHVGLEATQAQRILDLAEIRGTPAEILERVQLTLGNNAKAAQGLACLRQLYDVTRAAGLPDGVVQFDLAIARGLDYYTGTVYETFLTDLPGIGSVCSGGRYDNLASLYTKQVLPGVGASLGVDRLLAAMQELNLVPASYATAPVLIVFFVPDKLAVYMELATRLRRAGMGAEVYPEAKKLRDQLSYANKRGHRVAIIGGEEELAQGVWQVKDLRGQIQQTVADAEISDAVRRILLG
ncbi:MAG: histidine--tRNA ligase [Gemmatales bacterium]|nr:histidine--tRNA ligase [Gemmatales bacterium]MDW7993429.1 histidine--tRNA ligase [Gemmatales bacterium]